MILLGALIHFHLGFQLLGPIPALRRFSLHTRNGCPRGNALVTSHVTEISCDDDDDRIEERPRPLGTRPRRRGGRGRSHGTGRD